MERRLVLLFMLIARTIMVHGQCMAAYSYSGTTDTLTFINQSTISNPHFYWNFGDGSGSNDVSPVHAFPDDGKYLVTLYGLDTVSKCVDVEEKWVDVTKPDTLQCDVLFTDTIIASTLYTNDMSFNCPGLNINCNVAGPAQNYCGQIGLGGWFSSLFLHGMQSSLYDSINGPRIYNAYYKTLPWNYSSATNYQNCSANFEVVIDYQPTEAVATFTAMNKTATSYTYYFTGFGNPIAQSGQSVSYNFFYENYRKYSPWNVYLIIADTVNHCADSVDQQILIRNLNYVLPGPLLVKDVDLAGIKIYPNPASATLTLDLPANMTTGTATIYSLPGQKQISRTIDHPKTNMDLSGLSNGMYFIELSSGEKRHRQVFIKQQ